MSGGSDIHLNFFKINHQRLYRHAWISKLAEKKIKLRRQPYMIAMNATIH